MHVVIWRQFKFTCTFTFKNAPKIHVSINIPKQTARILNDYFVNLS